MKNVLVGRKALRNIKEGDAFYDSDLQDNVTEFKFKTPKNYKWCIPVRHRDVYKLLIYLDCLQLNSTCLLEIYKLSMRKSLQKI